MHKIDILMEKDIMEANRRIAEENRKMLADHNVRAFDILGSIGSGKTTLIEKLSIMLREKGIRSGAIAGDVAGDDDYRRFKQNDMPAVNINTGKECHLDAHLVEHAIEKLPLDDIDILFIENVGNLVCPGDFLLGSEKRIVVISATEGEDMVRKHPLIFANCDFAVLNKIDLAGYMDVNPKNVVEDFRKINPHKKMFLTDAKHGEGLKELMKELI
ncbi:MAG: hydrogenase nickel incorporation protein HypB [Thermoplasmatales archaeon]|nr:hydrogenase nickel incorporation protein HypB [Thermoplasmatales archaeon]